MKTQQKIAIDEQLFHTTLEAARVLAITDSEVEHRCRSRLQRWNNWRFINTAKHKQSHVAVWYKGVRYRTVDEITKKLSLSRRVVEMFIHAANFPDNCYELNEVSVDESAVEKTIPEPPVVLQVVDTPISASPYKSNRGGRVVVIEGVEYESMAAASRALNIRTTRITSRIASKHYEWRNWRFK